MKKVSATIHGRVQGVSFRFFAQKKALELGLSGWVRNESDGTVSLEAEGEPEKLKEFLEWCQSGSPAAEVAEIERQFSDEMKGFEDFEIRH